MHSACKLLAKHVVNMAGYWPCSFQVFTDKDSVKVHKHAIKEQGQHSAILTEQACSKQDFLYGKCFGLGKCSLQDTAHNPQQTRQCHLAYSVLAHLVCAKPDHFSVTTNFIQPTEPYLPNNCISSCLQNFKANLSLEFSCQCKMCNEINRET